MILNCRACFPCLCVEQQVAVTLCRISCIKQKLDWWRDAWFSLLSQNKRIAHLFPQIFISAEPKRIDILGAELSCLRRFPSVSTTYPNDVSLQCFFWHCNRCLTWWEAWRQNVCKMATRSCLQMPWEFAQVRLYGRAVCLELRLALPRP
jgi:hypothetical protein